MKKILSIVLAIALVLGSFSFAFAAAPPADVAGSDYEEAVNTLMGFGVINGYPDGTYKPGNIVTRAEMAKLLVITLGYGDLAGGSSSFSDMAGHWADGYVSLATGLNLVIGYPDGTFKPDATVTYDEAITMIIRGLGYTDESLPGVWPTDYKIKALELGILDDVKVATGGANRGDVAIMLFNALNAEYGQVNADDIWEVNSQDKMLIDKLGTKVEEQLITYYNVYGADYIDYINKDIDEDEYFEIEDLDDGMVPGDKVLMSEIVKLEDYLYDIVDLYVNKDDEVVYISKVHTLKVTGDKDSDSLWNGNLILKLNDDVVGEVEASNVNEDNISLNNFPVRDDNPNYPNGVLQEMFALKGKPVMVAKFLDEDNDNMLSEGDEVTGIKTMMFYFPIMSDTEYEEGDEVVTLMAEKWPIDESTADLKLPLDEDGDVDLDKVYYGATSTKTDLTQLVKGDRVMYGPDIEYYRVDRASGPATYEDAHLYIAVGGYVQKGIIVEVTDPTDGYHDLDSVTLADGQTLEYFNNFYPAGPYGTKPGVAPTSGYTNDFVTAMEDESEVTLYLMGKGGQILNYEFTEEAKDYAIVVDIAEQTGTPGTLGFELGEVILLTQSGNQITYDIEEDLEYDELGQGDLVEFSLNSDGEVDSLDYKVLTDTEEEFEYNDNIQLLSGDTDYYLADNVTVFDLTENVGDWDVMDANDIGDEVIASVLEDDDSDAEVVIIYESTGSSGDEEYALITKSVKTMVDGDLVDKLTVYLDGVMKTLYTDDDGPRITVPPVSGKTSNEFKFGEVVMDSDGVTITDSAVAKVFNTTQEVQDVRSDSIKINGTIYELNADLVIYLVEANRDEVDNNYDLTAKVINIDDVDEDMIADGNIHYDEDGIITLVVADKNDNDTNDWLVLIGKILP